MSQPNHGRAPLIALLAIVAIVAALLVFVLEPGSSEPDGLSEPAGLAAPAGSEPVAPVEPIRRGPADPATAESRNRVTIGAPQVVAAVKGRVVDHYATAVENARVILRERLTANNLFGAMDESGKIINRAAHTAITDAGGWYEFDSLPVGRVFDVWAYHSNFAPTEGVPVTPVKGEPQEMRDIVLESGYVISGRVTDKAGAAVVAKLEAELQRSGFHASSQAMREEDIAYGRIRTVESGPDGSFEIDLLAEGIWKVIVSAEGHGQEELDPIPLFPNTPRQERFVTLGEEFVLAGVVRDEAGNPVAGAEVHAARIQPRPILNIQSESRADGSFVLRQLPGGLYSISVIAEGFSHGRLLRLRPNKTDLEVTLQKRAGVAGRVTDSSGRPVTRFNIELKRILRTTTAYGWTSKRKGYEDANGNYLLDDLEPGTYSLLVTASGHAPTYTPGFRVDRDVVRGIDVQLKAGAVLEGRVISATGGAPLPGAEVILRGKDYSEQPAVLAFGSEQADPNNVPTVFVKVGNDGRFVLRNAYPAGACKLQVRHPTHLTEFLPLTVEEGMKLDVGTIQLRQGGAVVGTAIDASGRPLSGGTVYLTRRVTDGAFYHGDSKTLDARGRFRFDALPAGVYDVGASSFDTEDVFGGIFEAEESQQEIIVREGETLDITIRVP